MHVYCFGLLCCMLTCLTVDPHKKFLHHIHGCDGRRFVGTRVIETAVVSWIGCDLFAFGGGEFGIKFSKLTPVSRLGSSLFKAVVSDAKSFTRPLIAKKADMRRNISTSCLCKRVQV